MMYISGIFLFLGVIMLRWGIKMPYQDFQVLGALLLIVGMGAGFFTLVAFQILSHYNV